MPVLSTIAADPGPLDGTEKVVLAEGVYATAQAIADLGGGGSITVQNVTSASTITPTFSNDIVRATAQAAALTVANPTGTAVDGHGIVFEILDNGTARGLTFGSQYRGIGGALPTTTIAGKRMIFGAIFNNADTKWNVILPVAQEA